MYSWSSEQYHVSSNPAMMQNQIPPPLIPHEGIIMGRSDWHTDQVSNDGPENFIGPIPPEDQDTTMDLTQDDDGNEQGQDGSKSRSNDQGLRVRQPGNHRESRWNRNRDRDNKDYGRPDRDRGQRPRSHDRSQNRGGRSRSNRGRDNRERVSRFDPRDNSVMSRMPGNSGTGGPGGPDNYVMPGMMPFSNNMPNIPNSNMIPSMNLQNMLGNMMIPGVMDQNIMMQQMQVMGPQALYLQSGVLLSPIPGISMPPRRDRPAGCKTIFVGGLPPGTGMETINEIFQKFGRIDDIKLHKQGVCHIRFMNHEMVEQAFFLSGFRFKIHNQSDNEATTLFIDYALNHEDQNESENRAPTPPRIELFTSCALTDLVDKIKSDTEFAESAPTLAGWLERGECNKKNANTFYTLIQLCNNQVRRLYNEKMGVDEECFNLKATVKDKFAHIIFQFEQVAKILSAAKHKRASDHFSKQQRRNIDMWHKMTQDLENIKEEYNMMFDDEESEKTGQKHISSEKYEQLKAENDSLICELDGYRNEAHLVKQDAERKFEKFKAQFIAQQALHGRPQQSGAFPSVPPPPIHSMELPDFRTAPPPPLDVQYSNRQETKLVAMLTAFLLAHPLGATLDCLASYARSMAPDVTAGTVNSVLVKHGGIFGRQAKDKWTFVLFDIVKKDGHI